MTIESVLNNERQWHVECGDSLSVLKNLPDGCVHVCLTSPPYFALRSYLGNGHADKAKELGLEKSPAEYVARMVEVFREVKRVLHPSGIFVLNIGDSYNSSPPGNKKPMSKSGLNGSQTSASYRARLEETQQKQQEGRSLLAGLPAKNLLGIPWRLALALQEDGWILRNSIPWQKLSPMPSSAQDRLTVAHEDIFLFAKSKAYFWDSFAVRRPSASATLARDNYTRITTGKDGEYSVSHDHETPSNPAGRQWRTSDVWLDGLDLTIAEVEDWLRHLKEIRKGQGLLTDMDGEPLDLRVGTEPSKLDHYAVFPSALVRPFLRAGCSERGVCAKCGEPWRRVIERERINQREEKRGSARGQNLLPGRKGEMALQRIHNTNGRTSANIAESLGWQPGCSCNASDTIPPLVLDCFAGTGTTGVVARQLGLRFLGIELNQSSVDDANARIAAALNDELKVVPKRDSVPTLFDALETPP